MLNNINHNWKGSYKFMRNKYNLELHVSGNVERAIRQLKKKVEREGIVRDMKRTVYFEPHSQKKRKRLMRAVKQNYIKMASKGVL